MNLSVYFINFAIYFQSKIRILCVKVWIDHVIDGILPLTFLTLPPTSNSTETTVYKYTMIDLNFQIAKALCQRDMTVYMVRMLIM